MPELTATLEAIREKERKDRVFFAALKGIDLSNVEDRIDRDDDEGTTFADIEARVYGEKGNDLSVFDGLIGVVEEGE